jgi:hypothetical protein
MEVAVPQWFPQNRSASFQQIVPWNGCAIFGDTTVPLKMCIILVMPLAYWRLAAQLL